MAFPFGWSRKCSVTIQSSQIDSALTDWTGILTEDTLPSEMLDESSGNACQDGGGDVRITTDAAGTTQVPIDVRACHPTADGTGSYADIAFKVPSVSDSADTTLYVWYGKAGETQPAVDDTYGQYAAYDANYKIVLPLNEDPDSGGAGDIKDRTVNAMHFTPHANFTSADLVDGAAYKAINFDGSTDRTITSVSAFGASLPWTAEVLFKPDITDGFDTLFQRGWMSLMLYLNELRDAGSWSVATSLAVSAGTWYYGANVHTSADKVVYLNADAYAYGYSGQGASSGTFVIGEDASSGGREYDGLLDELRISSVARSAAWTKANYLSLLSPATLYTTGTPADGTVDPPAVAVPPLDTLNRSPGSFDFGDTFTAWVLTRDPTTQAPSTAFSNAAQTGDPVIRVFRAGDATPLTGALAIDLNVLPGMHLVTVDCSAVEFDPGTGGALNFAVYCEDGLAAGADVSGWALFAFTIGQYASISDMWSRAGLAIGAPPADTDPLEHHIAWFSAAIRHRVRVDRLTGVSEVYDAAGAQVIGTANVLDDGDQFIRDAVQPGS